MKTGQCALNEESAMEKEIDKCTAVEGNETEVAVPATGQPKKKPLARRILKWVLWSVAGLLAFVLVAALTLPLWINPVGTFLANALVPKYTGTAFNVDRINLNPYTGKLLISGVKLANPEGYAEKDAFTLGSLSADVEVSTLLSDTIHVREITIDSPFASYVFDANGVNNFVRIMEAVNEKLGPKKKKKDKGETKVVIDKITVKNVRAAVGNGAFELESLTLADFGKETPAQIELFGARLVNPEGFPEPNAFTVKSISIGMETADLSKKPVVFHDILVDSPCVFIVDNDADEENLDVIFKPLKSGAKKDEEKKSEKKVDDGPAVVIDKLDITGTRLKYGPLPAVPIPLPTFTNIGKEDGSSFKAVCEKIGGMAKSAMAGIGKGVKKIKDGAIDLLDKVNPANLWK